MSRSGYSDDLDEWALIRWRGAVKSAIKGKRGQAFLRELAEALDAMPEKRLIAEDLVRGSDVCALGSVGAKRGIDDLAEFDPYDRTGLAGVFGIAEALVAELAYINDEDCYSPETPEHRWLRVRHWVTKQIAAG